MSIEQVKSEFLLVKSYGTKFSGLASSIQYFPSHMCNTSKQQVEQSIHCTNHRMINSEESQLTWFVEQVCKTNKSIRRFHV